ncbi:MAG: cobalamin biosynthesis protein [Geobacteraceae bacterium]|nr:cobalamin biosynthesis protein [Geobacteraceae bacterium]
MKIAFIAITASGALLGERLSKGIPSSELFIPLKYAASVASPASVYTEELRSLLARLWQERQGLVCIMASGIVVRMIAPLLEGKDRDPAIVVMDDAGRFAVSLLSGHLGGANLLAEQCALATGATAVITTATDVHGLPSFDMLAKEQGWVIDDLSRIKILNTLLLEGGEIAVVDRTGQVERFVSGRGNLSYYPVFQSALCSKAAGFLFVTNRKIPPEYRQANALILRPRNLALGVGCNSGTSMEEIEEVVLANLEKLSLSFKSVCCLASAIAKRSEPGLLAFAEKYCISTSFYESAELNAVQSPSPPSAYAYEAIGAVGVAEPAALLASGNGILLLNKVKSCNVTLAIAEKV